MNMYDVTGLKTHENTMFTAVISIETMKLNKLTLCNFYKVLAVSSNFLRSI